MRRWQEEQTPKIGYQQLCRHFQKGLEDEFPDEASCMLEAIKEANEKHDMSISNCVDLVQGSHYDIVGNDLIKALIYFYPRASEMSAVMDVDDTVAGITVGIIAMIKSIPKEIIEQMLSRLLLVIRNPEGFNILNYFKMSASQVHTVCRKHKHENETAEELMQGKCAFQCFS